MFGFIKKVFKKDEVGRETSILPKPIELNMDEKISLHKEEDVPKIWRGRIHSIAETTFSVDIPELMEEFPFPFREGDSVLVSLIRNERTARFSIRLSKIAWKSKPPLLVLEYPMEVQWVETKERKHIRIPTNLPAKVKLESAGSESWQMVRVVDFSITGLSFLSSVPFRKGDKLNMQLMSMQYPLSPRGIVVRAFKLEERASDSSMNYNIGVKFADMSEMDMQMYSNFAYHLQKQKL